jgi:hypothetical protein
MCPPRTGTREPASAEPGDLTGRVQAGYRDSPAYQQILTAFADAGRPMRARDLCEALDLPVLPKNTEGIRSKLKRMVSRGILTEPEPGLFTRPARNTGREPANSEPHPTPREKGLFARMCGSVRVMT